MVGRFRLLYHGLAWVLSNPCILPETRVQLGIELGVTSSSTMGGVMLLGMVIPCSILSLIITRAHFDYEKQRERSRLKATIRDLQPSHSHLKLIQLKLLLVICLVSIQPWVVHLFPGNSVYFRDIMERMEHLLHSMLSGSVGSLIFYLIFLLIFALSGDWISELLETLSFSMIAEEKKPSFPRSEPCPANERKNQPLA